MDIAHPLTEEHKRRFEADGFLILDKFIDADSVERLRARFEPLFKGEFETGLYPDEWNWQEGRDKPDRTRQICNGWKSDRIVASVVLSAKVGRCVAELSGWDGARICQDNVIWKPAGAKALGYHQDDSYSKWFTPSHMATCWIALDDTSAAGGTIEYARGSHKWGVSPPIERFHAPEDYQKEFRAAAERAGVKAEIVPIEVPAGGCAFHHGGTWHGSDMNRADRPRRSVVAHCMSSDAQFHPSNVSYIYNRYKRHGDLAMDESFFPILWHKDGHRTAWLDRARHA